MVKAAEGRKFNRIPELTKIVNEKTFTVAAYLRSNRSDSKGNKKIDVI